MRGGSMFFFGPKQAVGWRRFPADHIISGVERAFLSVDHDLRKFVSDETVLGVLTYLMGIREVPWTIVSHHYHHGSTKGYYDFKLLVALARMQFAHALSHEFRLPEFRRYWLKYRLSYTRNLLRMIV